MINQLEEFKKKFKDQIYVEENLSKYSWFNIGGPAEILFKPDSTKDLISFLKEYKGNINILGAGSNTLIRDGGVKDVTIKLSPKFSYYKILNDNIIEVGAATLDKRLSSFAKENLLTGFEFLACIPGSVGGAITMNSGCYGHEISKILLSFKTIDFGGNIKEILASDINFNYRSISLPKNLIIISAKFKGSVSSRKEIEEKEKEMINKKKNDQPNQVKTCGSTFKNPTKKKAWELIKTSGCNSLRVGNVKMSDKHCNFFINEGEATSKEIEDLISKVRDIVFKKTKVNLELEVKIIGQNK